MDHESTKYDLLKAEFLLAQQQMDKYDQLSTTIKTWAITLWAASSGWAIQTKEYKIFLLTIFATAFFWVLDGYHKTVRQNYKKRRNQVESILNQLFENGMIPAGAISPKLPVQNWKHLPEYLFSIHIAIPYLIMIFISLALYFFIG